VVRPEIDDGAARRRAAAGRREAPRLGAEKPLSRRGRLAETATQIETARPEKRYAPMLTTDADN
jgi:hypothetical protein